MHLPHTIPETQATAESLAKPVEAILKVLREGERFLVCSHSRPDGDAVGSMLAMGMLLEQMGKRADLVTADRVPIVHRALPCSDSIRTALRVHGPYDAAILLECDGPERTRLLGLEKFLLINIDHHASGSGFGHVNWIDREATSVGELVYRLIKAAGARVTPEIATCIYTTVLTDTGGFIYGATRASTFELARDLVLAGADPIRIAQDVYFSTSMSKLLLLGAALTNLKREGRLAWLWITHQDMVRSCAATHSLCTIARALSREAIRINVGAASLVMVAVTEKMDSNTSTSPMTSRVASHVPCGLRRIRIDVNHDLLHCGRMKTCAQRLRLNAIPHSGCH